ncbi:MAG TPA: hypothetical protein VNK95_07470 [Caldilineaceae bacterium]|nr:hypothetical protein [Caldilineaceae bacterium]
MHSNALAITTSRRLTLFLFCFAILVAVACAFAPASVQASAVSEAPVLGNPTCSMLVPDTTEFKVEPVQDGAYSDGALTVTIDVQDTPTGPVFDFTANLGVTAVVAKGGPAGNFYSYDPAAAAGTGLHAPVNPHNNKYYGLSHLSFCYDALSADTPSTDTPPMDALPTDTSAPETTIDSGPELSTTSTDAAFTFSANEPGSTFECSLDGAAFAPCTSPVTLADLGLGAHTFQVRATDPAGNGDDTPASYTWTITPPAEPTTPDITEPANESPDESTPNTPNTPNDGEQGGDGSTPDPDGGSQPDSGQPDNSQPDSGQPNNGQPDNSQPDNGQLDNNQPDSDQPDNNLDTSDPSDTPETPGTDESLTTPSTPQAPRPLLFLPLLNR